MSKVSAHQALPQHQLSHPYAAETATSTLHTFSLVAKYILVLRLLQVNVLTPPSTEVMH